MHFWTKHDAFDDIISVSKKITWLRNPCDRIYSYYNHIMTRPDYNNKTTLEVYKSRCNFRDFIQLEWMQNNALNYLKDSKPNDYFFIGITEYFNKSVLELNNNFFTYSIKTLFELWRL